MRITFLFLLCIALARGGAPAQTADTSRARLTIETGVDTALAVIDSASAGRTPLTLSLAPGRHILRLVHADVTSWLTGSITDTLSVNRGEERTLRYRFERRFLVITTPDGASVTMGDSVVGTTPLVMRLPAGADYPTLLLRKKGYAPASVTAPAGEGGIARAILLPAWQAEPEESPLQSDSPAHNPLRYYVAGGVTLLSGAATAHLKIRADEMNDLYLQTGDPARWSETRRYDAAAAITLVATEIGFAFLTYFLLSD